MKVGAWGGSGGCEWSYVPKGGITEIEISSGWVIDSLSFKGINENSVRECSQKFGGGGGNTRIITINWPREYLTSISGTHNDHYGRHVVQSLYFYTNLNTYGPFGGSNPNGTKGIPFDVHLEDQEIAGFFGRASNFLDAIGVYRKGPSIPIVTIKGSTSCSQDQSLIKVGAWGGSGGCEWSYVAKGGITEIEISSGWVIDSLSFKGINENSIRECSQKFGGGGGNTRIITIDWPKEYLTSISGTHNDHYGHHVVQSLYFYTNLNTYGPFGGSNPNVTKGIPFNISLEDRDIVGLFGRASDFIDAIGIYRKGPSIPITKRDSTNTKTIQVGPFGGSNPNGTKGIPFNVPLEDREIAGFFGRASDFIDTIGVCRKGPSIPIVTIKANEGITMHMDLPREVGPWGGNKGKSWDDGLVGGIQQIDVHVGNGVVHAIQCRYHGRDGNLVLSNRHGGGGASKVYKIELENHSSEYLVGITGFYGPIDGNCCLEVVRSVSFYTNKGKYGPFGSKTGTFFNSPVSNAKLVGFHGRSGQYLDAIGVHVEYS